MDYKYEIQSRYAGATCKKIGREFIVDQGDGCLVLGAGKSSAAAWQDAWMRCLR